MMRNIVNADVAATTTSSPTKHSTSIFSSDDDLKTPVPKKITDFSVSTCNLVVSTKGSECPDFKVAI
jgi:hypothetical protein